MVDKLFIRALKEKFEEALTKIHQFLQIWRMETERKGIVEAGKEVAANESSI